MDLPDPRRGPCRPLFLVVAASLLACGPRQASGPLFISPDSLTAVERHRNVLALENVPEGVQEYSWYRGAEDSADTMIISFRPPDSKVPGPLYSNLVTVTSKGYLSFRMCTLNDTGNYTVRVDTGNELGPPPVISANASSAVENLDSVAAECHTNASHIEWYRNSVPISASQRIAISADGRTLVIRRVSRHDRTLQCVIQRYESFPDILQKSDTISLTVAYGPDYVSLSTNLQGFDGALTAGIGSQVQLECSCDSNPSPKYHWLHNGSLLSSDANLNFSLVAWEQMGNYRCIGENLVTQLAFYGDVRIQPPRPSPAPPPPPGFSISGPLVVFLILVTSLGCGHLCGILVYGLVRLYLRRMMWALDMRWRTGIPVSWAESGPVSHLGTSVIHGQKILQGGDKVVLCIVGPWPLPTRGQ
ncbi:carcinoembryonic antigen-related cell adhesion molecule 18 isoform X2 [Marmota monax]|uniref:carcinoembryonic antigen-related cell adhesion molecule 18 isoform X2 n=1 Tax=Marmota monax TaxID=9995 RepID=UPI001EAFE309|nr:carcinoembryonic antigen-related cell adhesion molecule 18 isoform X2 [Marmota monax]